MTRGCPALFCPALTRGCPALSCPALEGGYGCFPIRRPWGGVLSNLRMCSLISKPAWWPKSGGRVISHALGSGRPAITSTVDGFIGVATACTQDGVFHVSFRPTCRVHGTVPTSCDIRRVMISPPTPPHPPSPLPSPSLAPTLRPRLIRHLSHTVLFTRNRCSTFS